ncbi:MAG: DUF2142 domain-containing protein [Lachnospiraceae bacterium]|nr:DUF2142 domain-containing protein [Lachnospiraceae bacterium]
MDEILSKHKKLFVGVFIAMAIPALWQVYYVIFAMRATGHTFLLSEYGMLTIGLVMLSLCVGIFLICTNFKREIIWIIAVFLLGISFIRVMPGLSAPDEPSHYVSAYYLSNQLMMIQPDDEAGKVNIRKEDVALEDVNEERKKSDYAYVEDTEVFGQIPTEKNYYEVRNWNKLHDADPGMTTSAHIRVVTTPFVYLPQATGITIGRLFNTSALTMLNLGKIFNLLVFCILVYFAVRIMPFGKSIMMASVLLPMTVNLAASMSYDAMLIGCAYVFIAEILYLAYGADRAEWKDIVILAIILAVMSPCKIVYSLIVFLFLIVPREKFKSTGMYAAAWAILIVAAIGASAVVNAGVISYYASSSTGNVPWAGEPGFTVSYVLHHPLESARVIYDTLMYQGDYYHQTMIGAYLGNVNEALDVPYFVIMILTAGLVMLPLSASEQDRQLKGRDKLIILIVGLVISGLLLGSMMIAWTPLTSPVILGVQGRYFLPLLPAALLLLRNRKLALTKDVDNYVIFFMVCCNAFALYRLYSMICLYIPG